MVKRYFFTVGVSFNKHRTTLRGAQLLLALPTIFQRSKTGNYRTWFIPSEKSMALPELLNLPAAAKTDQWWRPKASSLLNILYLVIYVGSLPFAGSMFLF